MSWRKAAVIFKEWARERGHKILADIEYDDYFSIVALVERPRLMLVHLKPLVEGCVFVRLYPDLERPSDDISYWVLIEPRSVDIPPFSKELLDGLVLGVKAVTTKLARWMGRSISPEARYEPFFLIIVAEPKRCYVGEELCWLLSRLTWPEAS